MSVPGAEEHQRAQEVAHAQPAHELLATTRCTQTDTHTLTQMDSTYIHTYIHACMLLCSVPGLLPDPHPNLAASPAWSSSPGLPPPPGPSEEGAEGDPDLLSEEVRSALCMGRHTLRENSESGCRICCRIHCCSCARSGLAHELSECDRRTDGRKYARMLSTWPQNTHHTQHNIHLRS